MILNSNKRKKTKGKETNAKKINEKFEKNSKRNIKKYRRNFLDAYTHQNTFPIFSLLFFISFAYS